MCGNWLGFSWVAWERAVAKYIEQVTEVLDPAEVCKFMSPLYEAGVVELADEWFSRWRWLTKYKAEVGGSSGHAHQPAKVVDDPVGILWTRLCCVEHPEHSRFRV
ncbi:hypothetical protein ASG56_08250 [Rhodococcus sp. Leaf7]|nr:hypothetical protein ASG56_08250 [Rhodococcus sp. Leaf7]KQU43002.1 hypothetical protein ASG64_08250 [Rhodococcus sp. Leaf247]